MKQHRHVILQSSLQFVKVGTITQLIGRDVIDNLDCTLATFDNAAFDPAPLAADWHTTARQLGFILIGTVPPSPNKRSSTDPGRMFDVMPYAIDVLIVALAITIMRLIIK